MQGEGAGRRRPAGGGAAPCTRGGRRTAAVLGLAVLLALWQGGQGLRSEAGCSGFARAGADPPPGTPLYSEVWVDEGGVCRSYKLFAITFATAVDGEGLCITAASAHEHGFRVNVLGLGGWWGAWNSMKTFRAVKDFVRGLPPESLVLHIDAYDVLFNAPPQALVAHMLRSGKRVLFSAEKGCSAAKATFMQSSNACDRGFVLPDVDTAMPWLNAGVWVGFAKELNAFFDACHDEDVATTAWAADAPGRMSYIELSHQTLFCEMFARGRGREGLLRDELKLGIDYRSQSFLSFHRVEALEGGDGGDGVRFAEEGGVLWFGNTTCFVLQQDMPQAFEDKCLRAGSGMGGGVRPVVLHFNGLKEKRMHAEIATRIAWDRTPREIWGENLLDIDNERWLNLGKVCKKHKKRLRACGGTVGECLQGIGFQSRRGSTKEY